MFSLDGLQNALPVPTLSERVGDLGMRNAYHELRIHGITPGIKLPPAFLVPFLLFYACLSVMSFESKLTA